MTAIEYLKKINRICKYCGPKTCFTNCPLKAYNYGIPSDEKLIPIVVKKVKERTPPINECKSCRKPTTEGEQ